MYNYLKQLRQQTVLTLFRVKCNSSSTKKKNFIWTDKHMRSLRSHITLWQNVQISVN